MAQIVKDNITFNSYKNRGGLVLNNYPIRALGLEGPDEDGVGIINAVDIDWNGAEIEENVTIHTTAELLNWIKTKGGKISEIDSEKLAEIQNAIEVYQTTFNNVLGKSFADSRYQLKADSYTKDEIDSLLGEVETITGAQGPQGAKGAQGVQGAKGEQGETGAQGPQGAKGDQGEIGAQGAQGVQGAKGDQGEIGAQGAQGVQGAKGDQGDIGATGAQGVQGAKGEQGETGAQGPQGAQGATGTFDASDLENYASKTYVGEKIAEVVGAAPETLDTLKEIADKLGDNDTALGALNTALESKANSTDVYNKTEIDNKLAEVETIKGDQGEQGPQGAQGAQGPQGETGAQGPQGATGTFDLSDLENYVTKEELGSFGTESEYNGFDYIYDEATWNDSFANGVLKKYYTKYPEEDLWNITEHRAANFNDKAYEVSIYNDAAGEDLVKEGSFKAAWASANAQKITNVEDANESYYLAIFYSIDDNIYELFTDAALTTSANLYVKMNTVSFPGCTQCWEGAVQAPGAKFPWICPNFETDANVMIKFQYEGKADVTPWNFSVFGKGPDHKEWGIASVATEFGDDTFAITENGGENAFDITKFKVITVSANTNIPAAIKAYIDTEIAKLKAQIGS